VLWLLNHPEEARKMGQQGRERVRRHFGRSVMCGELDRTYRELLGLPEPVVEGEDVLAIPRQRVGV